MGLVQQLGLTAARTYVPRLRQGFEGEALKLTLEQVLKKHPLPFTLYDWQKEDVSATIPHDRSALFLPVGAGKTCCGTLVALAWGDPTVLVLLPPILIKQWVLWLNSIPDSGGAVAFQGSPKVRHALPIEDYKFVVMSMDIFRNDFDLLMRNYAEQSVTVLVDEAQCLKSSASSNFRKIRTFSEGRKLLLMTGTEMSSPRDAYSYIKLKTPSVYRSLAHYENVHVAKRDFFDQPIAWQGLDVISHHFYQQSVKHTKEEIHKHLPKATYSRWTYDLDPAHKRLYDKLMSEMLLELPDGGKIDATTASALYNASQQIVCNWSEYAGKEGLRSAALDVLDEVFSEIEIGKPGSSKLIVWCWFRRTTESTLAYCNSKYPGAAVAAYSGADSVRSVARFMDDPKCLILVAQPSSAGMGLNPQHLCWECLFLEAPTRTIPFKQAAGRIDREGQKFNPTIRVAMAAGTIQEDMFAKLLKNDAEVMAIQSERSLRAAIFGHV